MNTQAFSELNIKEVVLGPHFFSSQKLYKYRSIHDAKSQNTIVMVNLDRATVYETKDFSEYIDNLIGNGRVKLILDFENVYFMDSVFFGSMIKLLKRVTKLNGYIKLIVQYDQKPELFALKTFQGIFETYPNLFEAMNSNK
jgi:anti-anti-sigma factor